MSLDLDNFKSNMAYIYVLRLKNILVNKLYINNCFKAIEEQ